MSFIEISRHPPARNAGVLAAMLVAAWACPSLASDPAGRVVDGEGKPVAGVTVSAIGRNWADPAVSASATTGPDGRFVVAGAWKLEELDLRYLALFARARDGRCGWIATVWREQPSSQDLILELGDAADVAARLVDQEGKPLPDVMVKLDILDRSEREKGLYDEVVLPRSLAGPFEARTDGDGRFVIKGIPRGAKVRALVDEPLVGRPLVFWDPAKVGDAGPRPAAGGDHGPAGPARGQGASRERQARPESDARGFRNATRRRRPPQITVSRSIPVRRTTAGSSSRGCLPGLTPSPRISARTPLTPRRRISRSRSSPESRRRPWRSRSAGCRSSAAG